MKLNMRSKMTAGAIVIAGLAAVSGTVSAADWSDNSISYVYGSRFHESYIPFNQAPAQNVKKDIFNFTHVSGYKYGSNLFSVDLKHSDSADPAGNQGNAGGGFPAAGAWGANDVYAVARTTLSFSKISGKDMKFGVIKDIGVTAGFDYSVKDTNFGARTWRPKIGPSISWDVPNGFLTTELFYQTEKNHCGTCNTAIGEKADVNFGGYGGFEAAWGFKVGSLPVRFNGLFTYYPKKGNNGDGSPTGAETFMLAKLLYDVGSLAGKSDTVYVGVGYQYWNNQFGNTVTPASYPFGGAGRPIPGIRSSLPLFIVEWHL